MSRESRRYGPIIVFLLVLVIFSWAAALYRLHN